MSSKTSASYKYSVEGKKARDALNQEEQELFDLCHLAGMELSPAVLRIILDLLKLNVSPLSIAEVLKSMIHKGHQPGMPSEAKAASRPSSRKGDRSTSSKSGATSSSRDKERTRRENKPAKGSSGGQRSSSSKT